MKPTLIEYTGPDGQPWKVQDMAGLRKELAVIEADLAKFHGICRNAPGWPIAVRLFGIQPMFPSPDADAQFLRVWTRQEIAAAEQMEIEELDELLDTVRRLWNRHLKEREAEQYVSEPATKVLPPQTPAPAPTATPPAAEQPEQSAGPSSDQRAIIEQFGFSFKIFDLPDRFPEQRDAEIAWFAQRLIELKKLFEEPMAKSLARQAIINEMLMRRCDDKMTTADPGTKGFWAIQDTKLRIEEIYQKQWSQLEEICPYVKSVGTKVTVTGTLSDWVEGYRRAIVDGDTKLLDGLFTAFEVQILVRGSMQDPDPKYRPGLAAAINEAKAGLWDPNFRRKLPDKVLRAMDEGFQEAHRRLVEQGVVKLTDLELEGPAGEYPPLFEAPEEDISLPESSVELEDAK